VAINVNIAQERDISTTGLWPERMLPNQGLAVLHSLSMQRPTGSSDHQAVHPDMRVVGGIQISFGWMI